MGYSANVTALKAACNKVIHQGDLKPEVNAKGEVVATFCNLGVYRIATELGVGPLFYNAAAKRPMLAAEMMAAFAGNPLRFEKVEPEHARADADAGLLVIAGTMGAPLIKDEHVAVVYPGRPMTESGKWAGLHVPYVANVGKINDVIGANYAFGKYIPEFYTLRAF